jgi:hypothetical protein
LFFFYSSEDILRSATSIISNEPNSLNSTPAYDEVTIVSKISSALASKSAANASLFLNLYEQMVAMVRRISLE